MSDWKNITEQEPPLNKVVLCKTSDGRYITGIYRKLFMIDCSQPSVIVAWTEFEEHKQDKITPKPKKSIINSFLKLIK